jgi:DNA polymerase-3 subunit alpha
VYLHIGQGKVLRLADDYRVDIDRVVGELRMSLGHDAVML